jgi:hypothetical protein
MIALTALMCALLGYQITMPAVDNAKYSFTVYEGHVIRMNTQNGSFERCDKELKCQPIVDNNK